MMPSDWSGPFGLCALRFAVTTTPNDTGDAVTYELDPPYSLRLVDAQPTYNRTSYGQRLGTKRTGGRRLVAQWGETFLTVVAMSALRYHFESRSPTMDILWTDAWGGEHEFRATRSPIRAVWRWDRPNLYEPLIVTFNERPVRYRP